MVRTRDALVVTMIGFVIMLIGFVMYVITPLSIYITAFAIGLVVMVAGYILVNHNSRSVMTQVEALNEEETINGYVYYMSGEPMGLQTEIVDLTKR